MSDFYEYHAFQKKKRLKDGKIVKRWYYYYIDGTGKQIQKSCGTKVKSRGAAEDFIRDLPPLPKTTVAVTAAPSPGPFAKKSIYDKPAHITGNNNMLVREIAENMFIPGSVHLNRRQQLKKSVSPEVIADGRTFIKHIMKVWGDRPLRSLELDEVMNYIFSVERSGSWKNQYLQYLNEIYQEGQFLGCKIYKPTFPRIGRIENKADIFTEAELERLFKPDNFTHDFYLFFLTSLSGGLRLGEIRALRVKQIIFEKAAVIVDGFLKDDNKTRTTYNKKGSMEKPKSRVVLYPDLTLALLKRHIEKNGSQGDDYVFTYNGNPISKSMAERAFTVAIIKAGFTYDVKTLKEKKYWRSGHIQVKRDLTPDGRRFIPHSMRYTYITRMSALMDASDLQRFTGHDSKEMVDYYNRRNLEMALAAIPAAGPAATRLLLPQNIGKV